MVMRFEGEPANQFATTQPPALYRRNVWPHALPRGFDTASVAGQCRATHPQGVQFEWKLPRVRLACPGYVGLGGCLDSMRIAGWIIANVAVQVYTITVAGGIGLHTPSPIGSLAPKRH